MLSFENRFYNNLNKNNIFENHPKIAVAVSGGPDSMALVFLLQRWIIKKKGKLIALIIDHQIREGSHKEAIYVKNFLSTNNIESIILKISKKNINEGKMSQARKYRFAKIISYCKRNDIFNLFIGHHYDDNIETFLLRKIAGSNFEGLNSIQEKTLFKNILILRPLLNFSKKQILTYLKKIHVEFIEDPSNINEKYTRIIVRNFIKNYSNDKKYIIKDFKLVRDHYEDYIQMIYQLFILFNYKITRNLIIFDSKKFIKLDKELQTKFVEIIYKFFYPNKQFLRYVKIVSAMQQLTKKVKISINLANIHIKKDEKFIYFTNKT